MLIPSTHTNMNSNTNNNSNDDDCAQSSVVSFNCYRSLTLSHSLCHTIHAHTHMTKSDRAVRCASLIFFAFFVSFRLVDFMLFALYLKQRAIRVAISMMYGCHCVVCVCARFSMNWECVSVVFVVAIPLMSPLYSVCAISQQRRKRFFFSLYFWWTNITILLCICTMYNIFRLYGRNATHIGKWKSIHAQHIHKLHSKLKFQCFSFKKKIDKCRYEKMSFGFGLLGMLQTQLQPIMLRAKQRKYYGWCVQLFSSCTALVVVVVVVIVCRWKWKCPTLAHTHIARYSWGNREMHDRRNKMDVQSQENG